MTTTSAAAGTISVTPDASAVTSPGPKAMLALAEARFKEDHRCLRRRSGDRSSLGSIRAAARACPAGARSRRRRRGSAARLPGQPRPACADRGIEHRGRDRRAARRSRRGVAALGEAEAMAAVDGLRHGARPMSRSTEPRSCSSPGAPATHVPPPRTRSRGSSARSTPSASGAPARCWRRSPGRLRDLLLRRPLGLSRLRDPFPIP